MSYTPSCICSQCQAQVFRRYAPAALGEEQYKREVRMREERKKMREWNEWAKGNAG